MNFYKISAAALLALTLSSCATIFSGTTQNIHVKVIDTNNNEVPNPHCVVYDGSGASHVLSSNPGEVNVSKARGNVRIDCKKAGYTQLNMAVGESFNGVTVVNVLFWPGFIVDAMTGAYKDLPSHYVVSMKKN